MARSILAMIAAAAFGILLIAPDEASARAAGARGARSSSGLHHGGAVGIARKSAVHRHGTAGRGRMVRFHRPMRGWPYQGADPAMDDPAATSAGYGSGSGCYVERRQINDDY